MVIIVAVEYKKESYDISSNGVICKKDEYLEPTNINDLEFNEIVEEFESNTMDVIVYMNDKPYIVISRAIKFIKVVLENLDPEDFESLKIYEQMLNRFQEFENFHVIRVANEEETKIIEKNFRK